MQWELQLCRSQPSPLLQVQENVRLRTAKKGERFMSAITGGIQRL
jgi:hypothetical protein